MKNEIIFDFETIFDYDDFYNDLKQKLSQNNDMPEYFGENLDALYDLVTGYIKLPAYFKFIHMNPDQLEEFEDLIETLENAKSETKDFSFSYFLRLFEDDWDNEIEDSESDD